MRKITDPPNGESVFLKFFLNNLELLRFLHNFATKTKKMGVTYDIEEKKYVFDFEHEEAEDIGLSIQRAVDSAHKKINLYHYDIVVMPQNRTQVNQYMLRYIYRFNQPRFCSVEDILSKPIDEELVSMIRQKNVLVIDDVTTIGSNLNEVLCTLRILNEDNEITIFSLSGHKASMAKSV